MKEKQWNRRMLSLIGIAAFLIVFATVTMSVGNTMGRYVSQGQAIATFTPKATHAYVSETEWSEDLTLKAQVSNYEQDGEPACKENVTFRVRLYVKATDTNTTSDLSDLNITLKSSLDGEQYGTEYKAKLLCAVGASTYLGKGSGEGWMYVFLDQNGNELTYVLEKNNRSNLYFDIAVDNQNFEILAENLELKIETVRPK